MNTQDQILKLTNQNDELENYFKNTIIPQLFIDSDLRLRKFTPPAMSQFHLTIKDLGKPIMEIVNNFRFPSLMENINYVIETSEILEKEIQMTDLRWFQMNILPYITQKTRKPNGVIVTFVDITSRIKDLQEQESLIADHQSLLDTISHDINNPLTSLILTMELLQEGPTDQLASSALLKILDTGIRRIQDVVATVNQKRNKEYYNKYTVKELLCIENIIEDVRLTLYDKIVKCEAVIMVDLNVSEIYFSRRDLRSILYNLIFNSLKFMSDYIHPEIQIKTVQEGRFIILSVKDNNCGDEIAKYHDLCFKLSDAQSDHEEAYNGMRHVKEIVTKAGGKILLESHIGEGTEFKIYLEQR